MRRISQMSPFRAFALGLIVAAMAFGLALPSMMLAAPGYPPDPGAYPLPPQTATPVQTCTPTANPNEFVCPPTPAPAGSTAPQPRPTVPANPPTPSSRLPHGQ